MTVVHLKDFSVLSPMIQGSDLLKAIETAIPATATLASDRYKQSLARKKQSEPPKHYFCCWRISRSLVAVKSSYQS